MKRKSIIQGFSICAALIIFVVLTSGCVGPTVRTHGMDKLPKSEIAVIKGFYFFGFPIVPFYSYLDIYQVDAQQPEATQVEVLPGRHFLIIREKCEGYCNFMRLSSVAFNTEAGHAYKIRRGRFGLTVVDINTGDIIFSERRPTQGL